MSKKNIQSQIPIMDVLDNGIFQTAEKVFSKMYEFADSNFIAEDKMGQDLLVQRYEKFLKHFQDNVSLEFVIANRHRTYTELKEDFHLKLKDDGHDEYREEYNAIIDKKIEEGRNDIQKKKFLILSIKGEKTNVLSQFATLDNELNELMKDLNKSGVRPLSSFERMKEVDYIYKGHTDVPFEKRNERYFLDGNPTKAMKKRRVHPQDIVAPQTITREKECIKLDDNRYCKSLMFTDLPNFLDTDFLTAITNVPCEMVTTVLLTPEPRKQSIRRIKMRRTAIKGDISAMGKRASRDGYDPNYIIPEEMLDAKKEGDQLREDVVVNRAKAFYVTVSSTLFEKDIETLKEQVDLYAMRAADYSCTPNKLVGQQLLGLKTNCLCGTKCLQRDLWLSSPSCCALFPFNIQEIMDSHGHFYGINAISRNMIMYNRRTSSLPNGIILGKSGSGKSFITKGEIIPTLLDGDDDVIILDPDGEYVVIAETFGGTVIDLEKNGTNRINPCDMSMEWDDPKADPLAEKCDYMVGLVESILGERKECNPYEVSCIHRATERMYEEYIKIMEERKASGDKRDIDVAISPTLEDFYNELIADDSPEGNQLALILEPYCIGQYNLFAHRTNIEDRPRFLVYNLKNLLPKMKRMAMTVCLSNIWNRTVENKDAGKATWVYLDEFYLLCQTESSATTLQTYFKRIRKYFGIITGITQDIKDLLRSDQGIGMIENCGFLLIMNQSPTGREMIQKRYEVSDGLIDNITDKPEGHGLLYTGKSMLPFDYSMPTNSKLYKIMSTKPAED